MASPPMSPDRMAHAMPRNQSQLVSTSPIPPSNRQRPPTPTREKTRSVSLQINIDGGGEWRRRKKSKKIYKKCFSWSMTSVPWSLQNGFVNKRADGFHFRSSCLLLPAAIVRPSRGVDRVEHTQQTVRLGSMLLQTSLGVSQWLSDHFLPYLVLWLLRIFELSRCVVTCFEAWFAPSLFF